MSLGTEGEIRTEYEKMQENNLDNLHKSAVDISYAYTERTVEWKIEKYNIKIVVNADELLHKHITIRTMTPEEYTLRYYKWLLTEAIKIAEREAKVKNPQVLMIVHEQYVDHDGQKWRGQWHFVIVPQSS